MHWYEKLKGWLRFQAGTLFYYRYIISSLDYSFRRDGLERAFGKPPTKFETFSSPGKLVEAETHPRGMRLGFERAELDVCFLAPDLVRLDWKPGLAPVPYAIAKDDWEAVAVTCTEERGRWRVASTAMAVGVGFDGAVTLYDERGSVLREELPPEKMREGWTHRVRLRPEEHLYGLGERATPFNLRTSRGKNFRMWNFDMAGRYGPDADPLYICIPITLSLHDGGCTLAFYENSFAATFHFDADLATAAFEGGPLRYYLSVGTPASVLERYTELTGRPPLPPRWALGYHQSRWGYDNQQGVREALAGFKEHRLPLSAIHLDIDCLDGFRAFTIDPDRFPNLADLTAQLRNEGVKLVSIINPGIKVDHDGDRFREGQAQNLFCTTPAGEIITGPVWPGWCAFPDFSNPLARQWWGRQYDFLLDLGVNGFWHDMNEPAIFVAWGDRSLPGRATCHHMEGRGGTHLECHNLYGLLQARTGYESLHEYRPDHRPFIVSRAGWAGLQRYAWTWTGDVESSWGALRRTIAQVLSLVVSGIPYSGSDIGGFQGNPSAELYVRWFQLSTFMTFFRTHSSKNVRDRHPWSFGEPTLSIVRTFLELRYQLLPYLYTLCWQATRTGISPVRPLFWPDGRDPALRGVDDQFFLGDALLVCPVVEYGKRARRAVLPAGRWYDFWTDVVYEGPGEAILDVPLERTGLLVRAGAILPVESVGLLTLHVWLPADAQVHEAHLYSDAGDGYGPWRLDRLALRRTDDGLILRWSSEGEYTPSYSSCRVQVHGLAVQQARVDGAPAPVVDNGVRTGRFHELYLSIG